MDNANQMEFLFEEGGIADDGMNRDPISGNEVPSGSLAQEVRDDIPAQLSEGEYVVPADVVRYYGVKFFEDLRSDAKMGLNKMEQDGRIGGEPAMSDDDEMPLSPEEEAELQAIMGMAEGGMAQNSYDNPPPEAIGNTGLQQQMVRAFNEGGTAISPDFSQFGAGYSFMGANAGQTMPTVEEQRSVTLYGPNGEVVNLILPTDQEQYNTLITDGYSETPIPQPAVEAPQFAQQQQDSDSDSVDIQQAVRDMNYAETGSFDFSNDDVFDLMEDPLSWGREQLQPRDKLAQGLVAGIGLIAPGMGLIGQGAMIANDVSNIARARAALNIAQNMGLDTAEFETELEEHIANSRGPVRAIVSGSTFGTGSRYTETLQREIEERMAEIAANRSAYAMGRASRSYIRELLAAPGAEHNPGLATLAEAARRGRTGAGYRDIPTGKISGENGTAEGVVAFVNADGVPQVVRHNNKTVFRDEQGNLYVTNGVFGGYGSKNRTYIDEVVDGNGNVHRSGVSGDQIEYLGMESIDLPDVTRGIIAPDTTASSRGTVPSLAPDVSIVPTPRPTRGPETAAARAQAAVARTQAAKQAQARAESARKAAEAKARAQQAAQEAAMAQAAAQAGSGGSDDDSGGFSYSYTPPSVSQARESVAASQARSPSGGGLSGGANLDTAYSISGLKEGGFVSRRKKKTK